MAYCRFSDGDVYLFDHINGGTECCACRLAPLVPTIMSKGTLHLPKDDVRRKMMGDFPPCKKCDGDGHNCLACSMHDSVTFDNYEDVLAHLQAHRDAGDDVPEYAFECIRENISKGIKPPPPDPNASPILNLKTGKRMSLDELKGEDE